MFPRAISIPKRHSFFLFGPRQTGKSTLLRVILGETDLTINLLPQSEFLAFAREPGRFRREVLAHLERHPGSTIAVDEVQRLPQLLDEVHDLIESRRTRFILTGSSARKLKRGASNLLAGRAFTLRLYPLSAQELGDAFDLERALRVGTLPPLWDEPGMPESRFLRAYADTYLREEIQTEGVVRDIAPFARFLDVAALNDGQLVNYTSIGRDCGVSLKTIQAYYQILEDSFVAYRLPAWQRSIRKRLVAHARYYLFDPGVTNALCRTFGELNREVRGRRFEQWVVTQSIATASGRELDVEFAHWRTKDAAEVDLLVHRGPTLLAAAEIKSAGVLQPRDRAGLRRFAEEYPDIPRYIVGDSARGQILEDGTRVIHWNEWLSNTLPGCIRN